MHSILKRSVSLAAAAMMISGTALTVVAQGDENDGAVPAVPQPEECVIEPLAQSEIDAILESSEAAAPLPSGLPVPLGTPADDETQTTVTQIVRELMACLNAGDAPRGAAFFTDSGLLAFYGPAAADDSSEEQAPGGTPTARSEDQWLRLRTVTDISVMEDGRVAAFVVFDDPLVRGNRAQTLLFVFADDGSGLAIDEVVGFSLIAPTGTPTP